MKFLHITDLHMVEGGMLYGLDPAERLRECIADIMANHSDAELAVITGDLAHKGDEGAYRRLRGILEDLRLPTYLMLGNHDDRQAFLRVFDQAHRDENGFVQFTIDTNGTTFICLDTNETGVHHGVLSEERLAWLESQLEIAGDRDVFLFMHHPPFPVGIRRMDVIALRDADRFASIVARSGNVRHLFFGHLHRPISGTWRSIPFSNLPGLNHQVALDFKIADEVPGSHEPPTYAVVLLEEEATIVHLHHFLDRTNTFNL